MEVRRDGAQRPFIIRLLALTLFAMPGVTLAKNFVPAADPVTLNASAGYVQLWDVTHGDLNGNGFTDLIGVYGEGQVVWFPGSNAEIPPFIIRLIDDVGHALTRVRAADFNHNGNLDLVVGGRRSEDNTTYIYYYENDGANPPSFTRSIIHQKADTQRLNDLAIGDLNGNNSLDVVVAYQNFFDNMPDILFSDGGSPPQWTTQSVDFLSVGLRDLEIADLNGNGHLDVIAKDNNRVLWAPNPGGTSPVFTVSALLTALPGNDIKVADINGDGHLDLVVSNELKEWIRWYENDGDASPDFTLRHQIDTPNRPWSLDVVDVNGNGSMDIVAGLLSQQLKVYLNDGSITPTFITNSYPTRFTPRELGHGDLNGDGAVDLYHTSLNSVLGYDTPEWFRNSSTTSGVFTAHAASAGLPVLSTFAIGDLTGDGFDDVVSGSLQDSRVAWYPALTTNGTAFGIETVTTNVGSPTALLVTDLNGDGNPDLVVGTGNNRIVWFEGDGNNPPTFGPAREIYAGTINIGEIAAADLNNNGNLDLVFARSFGIFFMENLGGNPPTFTTNLLGNTIFPGAIQFADFNGNGHLDILYASGTNVIWNINHGATPLAFTPRTDISAANNIQALTAVDMNGNALLDLAVFEGGQPVWYENDGGDPPSYTRHVIDEAPRPAQRYRIVDIDGDGRVEFLALDIAANEPSPMLHIYEQTTNAFSYRAMSYPLSREATSFTRMEAADLNRDGYLDLVIGTVNPSKLYYLSNVGEVFGLLATDIAPSAILEGSPQQPVLAIQAIHGGLPTDPALTWSSLDLRLSGLDEQALTDAEAEALLKQLRLYLDDGSGVFESAVDTVLHNTNTFTLTDGVLTVQIPDGTVPGAGHALYFVTLALTDDASEQTPNAIRTGVPETFAPMVMNATNGSPVSATLIPATSRPVYAISTTSDADGDGIPDLWELTHFNSHTGAVANVDSDGDGYTNLQEYIADTDPNDPLSFLRIQEWFRGGTLMISFAGSTGRLYQVIGTTNLVTGDWDTIPSQPLIPGSPGMTIPVQDGSPAYLRLEVSLP